MSENVKFTVSYRFLKDMMHNIRASHKDSGEVLRDTTMCNVQFDEYGNMWIATFDDDERHQ